MGRFWLRVMLILLGSMVVIVGVVMGVVMILPHGDQMAYSTLSPLYDLDHVILNLHVVDVDRHSDITVLPDLLKPGFIWSPDGQSIALSQYRGEQQQLFITNSVFQNAVLYGEFDFDISEIVWSPDSKQIAFDSRYSPSAIGVLDIASGTITQMYLGSTVPIGLTWSPDGRWLMYEGVNPDGGGLYGLACNSYGCDAHAQLILPDVRLPRSLAISRDGQYLSFLNYDGDYDFYRYHFTCDELITPACVRDASPLFKIDNTVYRLSDMAWSPDGQQAIFILENLKSHLYELEWLDLETPDQSHTLATYRSIVRPVWLPDNNRISFYVENSDGNNGVLIVNVRTNESTFFAVNDNHISWVWRP